MKKKIHLTIDSFTAITKALSDSHRVRALCALRKGELCVCQVIELLCLAPSTISKHMSILKQAGLVDSRKDGRWVYYRIAERWNGDVLGDLIKQSMARLEQDELIQADDKRMLTITSEGLDVLCKRQKGDN